jgi:hypothetical protein
VDGFTGCRQRVQDASKGTTGAVIFLVAPCRSLPVGCDGRDGLGLGLPGEVVRQVQVVDQEILHSVVGVGHCHGSVA